VCGHAMVGVVTAELRAVEGVDVGVCVWRRKGGGGGRGELERVWV
jgi:hypothetical protein